MKNEKNKKILEIFVFEKDRNFLKILLFSGHNFFLNFVYRLCQVGPFSTTNDRSNRIMSEIYLRLTIKTPE